MSLSFSPEGRTKVLTLAAQLESINVQVAQASSNPETTLQVANELFLQWGQIRMAVTALGIFGRMPEEAQLRRSILAAFQNIKQLQREIPCKEKIGTLVQAAVANAHYPLHSIRELIGRIARVSLPAQSSALTAYQEEILGILRQYEQAQARVCAFSASHQNQMQPLQEEIRALSEELAAYGAFLQEVNRGAQAQESGSLPYTSRIEAYYHQQCGVLRQRLEEDLQKLDRKVEEAELELAQRADAWQKRQMQIETTYRSALGKMGFSPEKQLGEIDEAQKDDGQPLAGDESDEDSFDQITDNFVRQSRARFEEVERLYRTEMQDGRAEYARDSSAIKERIAGYQQEREGILKRHGLEFAKLGNLTAKLFHRATQTKAEQEVVSGEKAYARAQGIKTPSDDSVLPEDATVEKLGSSLQSKKETLVQLEETHSRELQYQTAECERLRKTLSDLVSSRSGSRDEMPSTGQDIVQGNPTLAPPAAPRLREMVQPESQVDLEDDHARNIFNHSPRFLAMFAKHLQEHDYSPIDMSTWQEDYQHVCERSKAEIRAQLKLSNGDDVFKDLEAFAKAIYSCPSVMNWQREKAAKREQKRQRQPLVLSA